MKGGILAVAAEQDHGAGGRVVGHRRVEPGGWVTGRVLLGPGGAVPGPGVTEIASAAVGTSAEQDHKVATLRSKLKRLVERGWLAEEAGPGLFALPARAGTGTAEPE
jgi:hypothetical protein